MRNKLLLLVVLSLFMCAAGSAKDGIPHVVKRFNLYNQTGPIGPITLYTPKRSGMFRVNTFMITTVGNGNGGGAYCGYISFADRFGRSDRVFSTPGPCLTTQSTEIAVAGTIPGPMKAGASLTFTVDAEGSFQGANYNIYIVVEEL